MTFRTTYGNRGFSMGPGTSTFNGVDVTAAQTARDSYFSSNPSVLAAYDSNPNFMIRLIYNDGPSLVTKFQHRSAGAWADVTPVVQGPAGEVASLAAVQVGEIPYKLSDGTFGGSDMRVLSDGSILAPPGFGVESGSVKFGDVLKISEQAGFLAVNNLLNGKQYTVVDHASPRNAISSLPTYFKLIEAEFSFAAQPVDTTTLTTNPLIFNYTVQNTARTNAITFRTGAAMSNVRIKVSKQSNGVALKYVPNKTVWEEGFGGLEWTLGDNTFDFDDTAVVQNAGDVLIFEIRATSVSLKGNATVPYFSALIQRGEFHDLVTDEDYEAADVRDKLTSLSGANRLPTSALLDAVISVQGRTGAVVVTTTDLNLQNVNNTSDASKPVSTLQQAAIDDKMAQHVAAIDPHTQYTTTAEAAAAAPVQSVNGLSGTVVLNTGNVAESGNLYYTDTRVATHLTANGYTVKSVASSGGGSSLYVGNSSGAVTLRSVLGAGLVTVTQNANDVTVAVPNVTSGTYTPTLTNVSGVSSSSVSPAQWLRVGNTVTVSGQITVDPTGAGGTSVSIGLSLPVASNFANANELAGTGVSPALASQCAGFLADAANDRASMQYVSVSGANHIWYYTYTYRVI